MIYSMTDGMVYAIGLDAGCFLDVCCQSGDFVRIYVERIIENIER